MLRCVFFLIWGDDDGCVVEWKPEPSSDKEEKLLDEPISNGQGPAKESGQRYIWNPIAKPLATAPPPAARWMHRSRSLLVFYQGAWLGLRCRW